MITYSLSGQITCIICKINVCNEASWPIHINSKKHKENIENAKKQLEKAKSTISGQKRSASSLKEPQQIKKVKGILKNANPQTAQVKSVLPEDFFDNKQSSRKNGLKNDKSSSEKASTSVEPVECMITEEENEEDRQLKGKDNASALPEGFFDDPVLDARVN